MFKLGDSYRIIRQVRSYAFDEIYEIDAVTTTTTVSRDQGERPPVYHVSFSRDESSGSIKAKCSVSAEYRDNKWYNPMSFDTKELDWKIIKL